MSDLEPHAPPATDAPVADPHPPDLPVAETPEPEATADAPPAVEMTPAPPARTAADGYAFAAVICAAVGLALPTAISLVDGRRGLVSFAIALLTAPAALLLARATEEPIASEPVSPSVARAAAVAQTLAYASIALVVTFCAAMLLGIVGRLVT